MTLWDLETNQKAFITEISEENPHYDKLISYGFKLNSPIIFLYKMAMKGPRVYQIGDITYSLSYSMAKCITITVSESESTLDPFLNRKTEFVSLKNLINPQTTNKN